MFCWFVVWLFRRNLLEEKRLMEGGVVEFPASAPIPDGKNLTILLAIQARSLL